MAIARLIDWIGGSLTRKFAALLTGLVVLHAAQFALGFFATLHLSTETALIGEATRQRMRLLLLGHLALQLASPSNRDTGRQAQYDEMFAQSEAFFRAREAARIATLYGSPDPSTMAGFRAAREAWQRDLRPLLAAARLAADPVTARALAERYRDQALGSARQMDAFVAALEGHLASDALLLQWLQAALLLCALGLLVVGTLMARRIVAGPLRRVIASTRALAAGAYAQSVAASTRDEMGTLAETFNRMTESMRLRDARVAELREAALALARAQSHSEVLREAVQRAARLVEARAASIALYDPGPARLTEFDFHGLPPAFMAELEAGRETLFAQALAADGAVRSDAPLAHGAVPEIGSGTGLPLRSRDKVLGAICVYLAGRDALREDELDVLSTLGLLIAAALESVTAREHVTALAETDVLTGLYNRRKLEQRLQEELRRSRRTDAPFSLLLVDIDHFKSINDTWGHPAGDAVLRRFGSVLLGEVRDIDFVARAGGEEFMLILPGSDEPDARHVAERIRRAVQNASFSLPEGASVPLTASVGIASYPDCAEDAAGLVRRVDEALYAAKQAGRNRIAAFPDMLRDKMQGDPQHIVALLAENPENARVIAAAADSRAPWLRGHSMRVRRHAQALGRELNLGNHELQTLRLASLLHGVALLALPDEFLDPLGDVPPEAQAPTEQRLAALAQALHTQPSLRDVIPVLRYFRERYDGKGFPSGLRGDEIPRLARALATAHACASLGEDRPQRAAMTRAELSEALRATAGNRLDPAMVEPMLRTLERR